MPSTTHMTSGHLATRNNISSSSSGSIADTACVDVEDEQAMLTNDEWHSETKSVQWTLTPGQDLVEVLKRIYPFRTACSSLSDVDSGDEVEDVEEEEDGDGEPTQTEDDRKSQHSYEYLIDERSNSTSLTVVNNAVPFMLITDPQLAASVIDEELQAADMIECHLREFAPGSDCCMAQLFYNSELIEKSYRLLSENISLASNTEQASTDINKKLITGSVIAVFYGDSWERGRILKMISDDLVHILLIDCGVNVVVPRSVTRVLPENLAHFPPKAVFCRIVGCSVPDILADGDGFIGAKVWASPTCVLVQGCHIVEPLQIHVLSLACNRADSDDNSAPFTPGCSDWSETYCELKNNSALHHTMVMDSSPKRSHDRLPPLPRRSDTTSVVSAGAANTQTSDISVNRCFGGNSVAMQPQSKKRGVMIRHSLDEPMMKTEWNAFVTPIRTSVSGYDSGIQSIITNPLEMKLQQLHDAFIASVSSASSTTSDVGSVNCETNGVTDQLEGIWEDSSMSYKHDCSYEDSSFDDQRHQRRNRHSVAGFSGPINTPATTSKQHQQKRTVMQMQPDTHKNSTISTLCFRIRSSFQRKKSGTVHLP